MSDEKQGQKETPSKFEPAHMQDLAERMIANGTMPSPEQLLAAMECIRAKHAERILKAREQDALEARSTSPKARPATVKDRGRVPRD